LSFVDAFVAHKVDFLIIFMKFLSKIIIFCKIKKPGGPSKELRGPLEGRGPPVEKHWFNVLG